MSQHVPLPTTPQPIRPVERRHTSPFPPRPPLTDAARFKAQREAAQLLADLAADHPNDEAIVRAALTICAACPVAEVCARELIGLGHGVVGGLTESQRRTVRRRARKEATA